MGVYTPILKNSHIVGEDEKMSRKQNHGQLRRARTRVHFQIVRETGALCRRANEAAS